MAPGIAIIRAGLSAQDAAVSKGLPGSSPGPRAYDATPNLRAGTDRHGTQAREKERGFLLDPAALDERILL